MPHVVLSLTTCRRGFLSRQAWQPHFCPFFSQTLACGRCHKWKHKEMTTEELHASRNEFLEWPIEEFCRDLHQEISTQKWYSSNGRRPTNFSSAKWKTWIKDKTAKWKKTAQWKATPWRKIKLKLKQAPLNHLFFVWFWRMVWVAARLAHMSLQWQCHNPITFLTLLSYSYHMPITFLILLSYPSHTPIMHLSLIANPTD